MNHQKTIKKRISTKAIMEKIIEAVDTALIKEELTPERFLRKTNKANNEIYVVNAHNSPNTMREIGRLREIAFRKAGGGTGKSMDIDEYDTMPSACEQLIVWNPDNNEIIGGYRYLLGNKIPYQKNGQPQIATAHLFHFSDKFLKEYMPHTIELGRSFVRVEYQTTQAGAKSLFALDNLWDGLGALIVDNPDIKYCFGKVTMYPSFGFEGRDMILYFLKKHFADKDNLVTPIHELKPETEEEKLKEKFMEEELKTNYKKLNQEIRSLGQNIPPLVNAYINLSQTMLVFGTSVNDTFGDVEETAILITINDIYKEKRDRHIETYVQELEQTIRMKRIGLQ